MSPDEMTVEQVLAFFVSVIKGGESWSPVCARAHLRAKDFLSERDARLEELEAIVAAAKELQREHANPAPDATMRRLYRDRLWAALDAKQEG